MTGLVVLLAMLGSLGALISAFQLGFVNGVALAGGVLFVYLVPATIFDWPRITWDHVAGFFSAITGFFASLLGW